LAATRSYYDEFAERYDQHRGGRVPWGYHDLLDELELSFLARHATGKSVLEVGCGTGLLLERMQQFTASAQGIDLSPGMLARARARGLDVSEASVTSLPFETASFDVVCAFKVLAHVLDIRQALSEMTRVTRVGGIVIAEFYNRHSLRYLAKRLGPAGAISEQKTEAANYTRFDTPAGIREHLPRSTRIIDSRGVRIVTPAAATLRVPVLRRLLWSAEYALCDTVFGRLGGFWLIAVEKLDR